MNTKTEIPATDLVEQAEKPGTILAKPPEARPDSLSGIGDLMRMVVEKEGSAEALAKVVELHNAEVSRLARLEYMEAMTSFQNDCPSIVNKSRADVYTYATLATIKKAIQPFLTKHGFSVSYTFEDLKNPAAQWIKASCTITHVGGHSETTDLTLRVPDEMTMGEKRALNEPQRVMAITTYAQRRLIQGALGLTTEGPDIVESKDLQVSSKPKKGHEGAYSPIKVEDAEPLDEVQCKTIEKLMVEHELDDEKLNSIVMELTKGTKAEWRKIPSQNYVKFESMLLEYLSSQEDNGEES